MTQREASTSGQASSTESVLRQGRGKVESGPRVKPETQARRAAQNMRTAGTCAWRGGLGKDIRGDQGQGTGQQVKHLDVNNHLQSSSSCSATLTSASASSSCAPASLPAGACRFFRGCRPRGRCLRTQVRVRRLGRLECAAHACTHRAQDRACSAARPEVLSNNPTAEVDGVRPGPSPPRDTSTWEALLGSRARPVHFSNRLGPERGVRKPTGDVPPVPPRVTHPACTTCAFHWVKFT